MVELELTNKMIKQFLFLSIILLSCGSNKVKNRPLDMEQQPTSSIYEFELPLLSGEFVKLSTYKGKKLLIVNTASECGYTPQYEGLQELSKMYGDKLTVIAFPANNFGSQEPGSDVEIGSFCKEKYGVTFPIFSKISVKGDDMAPLYQWLTQKDKNGWNEEAPNWNFCKYLIDEEGNLVSFYGSAIKPLGEEIKNALAKG